ncbi:MAG: YggS family pyridoxal phosphate enzyme [Epulopiscium sp. Nele67-Bin004]|nr:MAG: YggS family pyridoxal phosphate enzyme [Epulopiscium sp. Nele67-Bin004]
MLDKINQIQQQIEDAKQKSPNPTADITLIAVSKTYPIEAIEEAYANGIKDFGENKVQELTTKIAQTDLDINWHFIGHLQTNKVKYIVDKVVLIHSVDSIKLIDEIEKQAFKKNIVCQILLEINIANEESKFGFDINEVDKILEYIKQLRHVQVRGLMCVAPNVADKEENRKLFQIIYKKFVDIQIQNLDNVYMDILSVGMSNDFTVAVEEGSNCVRIGTAIFGNRQYAKRMER